MKRKLLLLIGLFFLIEIGYAQPYPNRPQEAVILKVNLEKDLIVVDILSEQKDFTKIISGLGQLKLTNENDLPIKPQDLRAGSKIHVLSNTEDFVSHSTGIKLLTNWEGENLKLEGILNYYDSISKLATIDGRKAKLDGNTLIEGKSKYQDKTFTDFSVITKGNFVTLFGPRQNSGIILANRVYLKENEFTSSQKKLRDRFESMYSDTDISAVIVPEDLKKYTDQLEKGFAKIGDLKLKILDNLLVQAYVNKIGQDLIPKWQLNLADSIENKVNFRFYVIESPILNAYALPNGQVFIHSGLLEILENEAQLATILSHEMAHVVYEHSAERLKNDELKKKAGLITKLVFKIALRKQSKEDTDLAELLDEDFHDGGVDAALKLVTSISDLPIEAKSSLRSLGLGLQTFSSGIHSKKREEQADRLGLLYMHNAGYNLMEASKIRKKIMTLSGETRFQENLEEVANGWLKRSDMYTQENPWESLNITLQEKLVNRTKKNWFCSHPLATKRYRNINHAIASDYAYHNWDSAQIGIEEFQKVITALKTKK
jgi:Zn-dependent protease with chaperone function